MSISFYKGLSKYLAPVLGVRPQNLTTASGTINGEDILLNNPGHTKYESALITVPVGATMKAAGKATFTVKVQTGDTTTGYADALFEDGTTAKVLKLGSTTSTASSTTLKGVITGGVHVDHLKAYARITVGSAMSVSSTATTSQSRVAGSWVFGGGSDQPNI